MTPTHLRIAATMYRAKLCSHDKVEHVTRRILNRCASITPSASSVLPSRSPYKTGIGPTGPIGVCARSSIACGCRSNSQVGLKIEALTILRQYCKWPSKAAASAMHPAMESWPLLPLHQTYSPEPRMHNTREGRANLLQEMPGNSQEPTGPSKPRPHYPAAQQPGWEGGKTQGKLCRQDCSVTKPTVHRLSCSTQLEHAHIQCTLYGGVGVERGPVFCQTQPNREHQHPPVQACPGL